ncbi:helix-turn-helix domain-containing protein [Flagellimonas sp.]|uniref:helix-turn-helix domain-containing protein n=1 Tax=Flagellimonas sp. TaxID=2058762 RepID=UPI003F49EAC6
MADFNLTNIALLFGMLQCILMILFIFMNRKWRSVENRILLGLLFVLLLSLIPPFVGNSKLVLHYDFLRFIPFYLYLFVFPLLLLYVKSVFSDTLTKKHILFHLALPFLFWFYSVFIWIGTLFASPEPKGVWAKRFGYFTIQTMHDVMLMAFVVGYTILSLSLISKAQKNPFNKEQKKFSIWIRTLIALLAAGVFFEMISVLLGKYYGYWKGSPVDEWLGFSFSLLVKIYNAAILYGISLVAYISFSSLRRRDRSIGVNDMKVIESISKKMEMDRMYLDNGLTLSKFSSILGITPVRLSGLINNSHGKTFNDFVNEYRIQEVIKLVKTGKMEHLTLEAISENAGFKSKTTFYRAFKKHTSKTPSAYFKGLTGKEYVSNY